MSENRILVIENPAHLRIDTGRLKIEREGVAPAFVSPNDVAVLCLEHHATTLSVAVLRVLAEAGASILVSDARHLPCAMQLPLAATGKDAGRLRQQILLDASEKRGELWQQLISAKLFTQAHALRYLKRKGVLRLERLAMQVQHGDKSNVEGQGAKHYWHNLFPEKFRRNKEGAEDPLNSRLNYGYAVLRAMIARSLVAAGLNCTLGLGHCNAENAFNLVDDFIEPFRFVVDVHIADGTDSWGEAQGLDSHVKRSLLGFVVRPLRISGQDMRLHTAIDSSIASFVRILEGKGKKLILPEGLATDENEGSWRSTDGV